MTATAGQVPLGGTWYRHIGAGLHPLVTQLDDAQGRWQRASVIKAIYLADTPETVWAEFYRACAELGAAPQRLLPRDFWRYEIALDHVADMREAGALRAAGLPTPSPDSTEWPAFQAVGEPLGLAGAAGIVWRAAARPTGVCVCVFEHAHGSLRPLDHEQVNSPPTVPRGLRT